MSSKTNEYQHEPDNQLPDISQLGTTHLPSRQLPDEIHAKQIAEHQSEIRRLAELAEVVEQAVSALMSRLRLTTDSHLYAALQHNSADLQHFKLEVELLQAKHQQAIEQLRQRR